MPAVIQRLAGAAAGVAGRLAGGVPISRTVSVQAFYEQHWQRAVSPADRAPSLTAC